MDITKLNDLNLREINKKKFPLTKILKLIPEKTKDFGYLKVFDLYSEEELKNIWNEILNLD